MQYPLTFTFKILTLAPKVTVRDQSGQTVFFVKQKLFKLKEAVNVFRDGSQREKLYTMKADRMLDFSARYNFQDVEGTTVGAVKRRGMRSLWRCHWDIYEGDDIVASIREQSVLKRIIERLLCDIPIVGFVVTLLVNPTYIVKRADGREILRLEKKPAFFEGKFTLHQLTDMEDSEEARSILSLIMMALLERRRG